MIETINKVQINQSIKTDGAGRVLEKSILLNIRADDVDEATRMFEDLQFQLTGNSLKVEPQITYEDLFSEPTPVPIPKQKVIASNNCPQCGRELKKRSGARGNFLGCSGYPNCRYTGQL